MSTIQVYIRNVICFIVEAGICGASAALKAQAANLLGFFILAVTTEKDPHTRWTVILLQFYFHF